MQACAAYLAFEMRARVPPRSAGLLNGHYDKKHGGKQARTGRTVVKLVTIFFVCTWLMLVYKHYNVSSFGVPGWPQGSSSNGEHRGRPLSLPGATELHPQDAAELEDRSSRHSRHKKKHKRGGVCTDSPLQEKEAFPEYGCSELEVREGKRERERERESECEKRERIGWGRWLWLFVFCEGLVGEFQIYCSERKEERRDATLVRSALRGVVGWCLVLRQAAIARASCSACPFALFVGPVPIRAS